tara:strand:- start:364 stop:588 length:225 start_codon:yes stop_codon:yes gene_type:complete
MVMVNIYMAVMLRAMGSSDTKSSDFGENSYDLLGDRYVHACMDKELVENEKMRDWPFIVLKWRDALPHKIAASP